MGWGLAAHWLAVVGLIFLTIGTAGLDPGAAVWNGSWNGEAESPSVLSAAVALSCGIGAGSGPMAWERASCKRQVELVRGTCVTADNQGHLPW